ncbi:hypothetical protein [Amycolatopsis sp. cmx-11-32]
MAAKEHRCPLWRRFGEELLADLIPVVVRDLLIEAEFIAALSS